MSISDKKIRCSIVIEKKDKVIIEKIAEQNDRSVNYIINLAVKDYIKKNMPDKDND